jgi:hypothetical protein
MKILTKIEEHFCSYCGKSLLNKENVNEVGLWLENGDGSIVKICPCCVIEAFDKLLGMRK